jgi:DNA end-binding protein Ku
MRAIWKGAVTFGLVSIPVKLYSATEERDIRFHQVHRADGGRVKYKRTCTACGNEVAYDELAKGYELESGEMVVLTDADLADLPLTTSREIDVLEFVPADQLDPLLFAKCYFLEPESKATKPYVLLREALKSTERMAIVKVALRQRESLAALRVRDDVVVLQMLLWPDEVREADFGFLEERTALRPQEQQMAASLVESMAGDFEPGDYSDQYREALQAVIEAKEGRSETVEAPTAPTERTGQVVDLMSALRASVERARTGRSGSASSGNETFQDGERDQERSGGGDPSGVEKTEPHKAEPHKTEPRKAEPHKTETHKAHKTEPHKTEPHKTRVKKAAVSKAETGRAVTKKATASDTGTTSNTRAAKAGTNGAEPKKSVRPRRSA